MTMFSTTSSRWAALQRRNPLAANSFIYSVITTKIYCRPTCPSRLARRANVIFHDTPVEAEAAGFRACKRCRPNPRENEGDPQILAVEKACALIREEGMKGVKCSVKSLAKEVGLTESHFCRVFKKIKGMTVGEYRMNVNFGKTELREEDLMNMDGLQPLHLELTSTTTNPIFDSTCELQDAELCASGFAHDWHDINSLLTPETTPPEIVDPLFTTNNCNFGFHEAVEQVENYFEFLDFDNS
ncbi:hypothetical protein VTL71DRAFT_15769 [Oculimacula yallundae]|uniref:HTH araC/xylS-type domain-containing protein n=1 Tax=Oculimacula yallundae TaxID=86028 RepID=A0ABR4CF12_9HELO